MFESKALGTFANMFSRAMLACDGIQMTIAGHIAALSKTAVQRMSGAVANQAMHMAINVRSVAMQVCNRNVSKKMARATGASPRPRYSPMYLLVADGTPNAPIEAVMLTSQAMYV